MRNKKSPHRRTDGSNEPIFLQLNVPPNISTGGSAVEEIHSENDQTFKSLMLHSQSVAKNSDLSTELIHCQLCPESLDGIFKLNNHLQTVHGLKVRLRCHTCGMSFSRNYHLKRHEAGHKKKRRVKRLSSSRRSSSHRKDSHLAQTSPRSTLTLVPPAQGDPLAELFGNNLYSIKSVEEIFKAETATGLHLPVRSLFKMLSSGQSDNGSSGDIRSTSSSQGIVNLTQDRENHEEFPQKSSETLENFTQNRGTDAKHLQRLSENFKNSSEDGTDHGILPGRSSDNVGNITQDRRSDGNLQRSSENLGDLTKDREIDGNLSQYGKHSEIICQEASENPENCDDPLSSFSQGTQDHSQIQTSSKSNHPAYLRPQIIKSDLNNITTTDIPPDDLIRHALIPQTSDFHAELSQTGKYSISNELAPLLVSQLEPPAPHFPCSTCKMTFENAHHLHAHKTVHLLTVNTKFHCVKCHLYFPTLAIYNSHEHRGRGQRRRKNSEEYASKKINQEVLRYPCNICGQNKKTSEELSLHKREHKGVKSFPCQSCTRVCTTLAILERHKGKCHATCQVPLPPDPQRRRDSLLRCSPCRMQAGNWKDLTEDWTVHPHKQMGSEEFSQ